MTDAALQPFDAAPRRSSLLVRLFSIAPEEAGFDRRGFVARDPSRRRALETVGLAFIGGYNAALQSPRLDDLALHLAAVPEALRGFAAEGVAMGAAIADALPIRRPPFQAVLAMLERDYTYLAHVGAGWAMARMPWRRRRILACLDAIHFWLAFDGMGFHDAYFKPRKVLAGWRRERAGYGARAYDQGVGRALWFASGGSGDAAAALIGALSPDRQGDLWSGLGLAMAYAGPCGTGEVTAALADAGRSAPDFAQGIAFACEAHARAGAVPVHCRDAARAIGTDADDLADLAREARRHLASSPSQEPAYEIWRRRVSVALSSQLEAP